MARHYATAAAFRAALEQRLNQQARTQGTDIMRLRRTVAFECFLARLFADENPLWLLKGGYSLELRLPGSARATKDIDITIPDLSALTKQGSDQVREIRERLQVASEMDLGDWFVFRVGAAIEEISAAPYGGARFPVEAMLAGKLFIGFRVDVALGDAVVSAPDQLVGHHLLDFAGIPPAQVAALPAEQHFAENIHPYTLPRERETNTRVKDLIDLVLLIGVGLPPNAVVIKALHATFDRRKTHAIPSLLTPPHENRQVPFGALAAETGAHMPSMEEAYTLVSEYWESLNLTS
jgi:hypothetical protein